MLRDVKVLILLFYWMTGVWLGKFWGLREPRTFLLSWKWNYAIFYKEPGRDAFDFSYLKSITCWSIFQQSLNLSSCLVTLLHLKRNIPTKKFKKWCLTGQIVIVERFFSTSVFAIKSLNPPVLCVPPLLRPSLEFWVWWIIKI